MRIFILGDCIIGFSFKDCFERPISSAPDAWFDVVERYSNDNNKTLKRTTKTSRCLNLGPTIILGLVLLMNIADMARSRSISGYGIWKYLNHAYYLRRPRRLALLFIVFVSVSMLVWDRINLFREHETKDGTDSFGGLGATMVDSLDTLYINGSG